MIIVKLKGGLGNQLFQYATARALAYYHHTSVYFDLSLLESPTPAITPRTYELAALGVVPVRAPLLHRIACGLVRLPGQPLLRRLAQKIGPVKEYREASFCYDPDIRQKTTPNTYLVGYFQSERYFEEIAPLLRRELVFGGQPPAGLAASLQDTLSVSLHVRRGDYASNPQTRQFHGLCSVDYYHRAVDYLSQKVGKISLFVFSDDQAWARRHLHFRQPVTFVETHGAADSHRDMQLMSLCQHHIIANSSFSWWGAWLNPSPYKIVIAPRQWFADESAQLQAQDITPTTWIRM